MQGAQKFFAGTAADGLRDDAFGLADLADVDSYSLGIAALVLCVAAVFVLCFLCGTFYMGCTAISVCARALWSLVRCVFCCCCRRRQPAGRRAEPKPKPAAPVSQCAYEAHVRGYPALKCGAGRCRDSLYCKRHAALQAPHRVAESPFAVTGPYTAIEHYLSAADRENWTEQALAARVARIVEAQPKDADKQKPGFLYIFRVVSDGTPFPGRDHMYKIGFTTQPRVEDRVARWKRSKFLWAVPTRNAELAEDLVHARLECARYRRYNAESGRFEIEWFLGRELKFRAVMERVAALVDEAYPNIGAIRGKDLLAV